MAPYPNRTILNKLATFVTLFYILYYVLSIILVAGFHVKWAQLGRFPFRMSHSEFNPGLGEGALGSWLAMVLTFVGTAAFAYWVVQATRKTWDYMLTTSLIHFVICCGVNQAFPVNWIWWVTLGLANLIMAAASEVLIYQLKDLRDIELGP